MLVILQDSGASQFTVVLIPLEPGVAEHGMVVSGSPFYGTTTTVNFTSQLRRWCHNNSRGGQVVVHCDNSVVVAAVNNKSYKEKYVMQLLRMLFFIEAHHQVRISAVHIHTRGR